MRFFTNEEVAGLVPELVEKLERARELADTPFVITSGLRTVSHNANIGGVSRSAHLTGEAADLACGTAEARLRMLRGILAAGFTRIEVGTMHIHVDVSKTLPQNVCWVDISH
jgi:uncharacterized protein YcbK (DUF882 family)